MGALRFVFKCFLHLGVAFGFILVGLVQEAGFNRGSHRR